jgi:hypothetical protein
MWMIVLSLRSHFLTPPSPVHSPLDWIRVRTVRTYVCIFFVENVLEKRRVELADRKQVVRSSLYGTPKASRYFYSVRTHALLKLKKGPSPLITLFSIQNSVLKDMFIAKVMLKPSKDATTSTKSPLFTVSVFRNLRRSFQIS